ncbi:MAG: hypothetical protein WCO92_03655, partial [Verrucomicrobiota bacterium]
NLAIINALRDAVQREYSLVSEDIVSEVLGGNDELNAATLQQILTLIDSKAESSLARRGEESSREIDENETAHWTFFLNEAALLVSEYARENLEVEKMPGGDKISRRSRIQAATEASTIADMLSSYVSDSIAKKRATHDNTPLFPIESGRQTSSKTEDTLQKAAAWEAAIKANLFTARTALETATKNLTDSQSNLEKLQTAAATSAHAVNEALTKRADAVEHVKSGALQTGGAALGLIAANPGPLVGEGAKLGLAVGGAAIAHLEVRKTAAEEAEAKTNLDYVIAKTTILGKIKERAEELHIALRQLQEEASQWIEDMVSSGANPASLQRNLTSLRRTATEDIRILQRIHAENLVPWSTENLAKAQDNKTNMERVVTQKQAALDEATRLYNKAPTGRAEKELSAKEAAEAELNTTHANLQKSERVIAAASNYKTQAESILIALESHNNWVERNTAALRELQEARMNKTSLENTRLAAAEEYEKVKAIYKANSTMNNILYSKKRKDKDKAKVIRTECEAAVEQATNALIQAEKEAQSATQDLASIDTRLNIWNNLRAWATVAIADQFKKLFSESTANKSAATSTSGTTLAEATVERNLSSNKSNRPKSITETEHNESAEIAKPTTSPMVSDSSELDDQKMPASETEHVESSDDPTKDISMHLKNIQLGHLAADLTEEVNYLQKRLEAQEAGKPIEPASEKKAASSDSGGIDTKLDAMTRAHLTLEHTAKAANQTGVGAEAAMDRYFAVATGETEIPIVAPAPAASDNPISAAVTDALITKERFKVRDETSEAMNAAIEAYYKAQAASKEKQAKQFAKLRK